MNHHFYANDTQLHNSALSENIHTLQKTTSDCYSEVKNWMTQNKFQLNSEKTEAMLIGTRQKLSSISVNTLHLDDTTVPLSDSVKSLGLLLNSTLSMDNFIKLVNSAYYQLRRTSSVRKYLSTEATVKLVTSLILSRFDYCNSLLSGLPASSVHSLRHIQNSAARLIMEREKKKKTKQNVKLM